MCDNDYIDEGTCVNFDVCEQNFCHENATCLIFEEYNRCICNYGLSGDGITCSGILLLM